MAKMDSHGFPYTQHAMFDEHRLYTNQYNKMLNMYIYIYFLIKKQNV